VICEGATSSSSRLMVLKILSRPLVDVCFRKLSLRCSIGSELTSNLDFTSSNDKELSVDHKRAAAPAT
jgi:hypothetical protein